MSPSRRLPTSSTSEALSGRDAATRIAHLAAKVQLGIVLKNRREELKLSITEVATHLQWTPQFYGEIEKGTKSTDDVGSWIRLADILQLDAEWLLEQVWEARGSLTIRLPPPEDPRRRVLLKVAVDQHSGAES